MAGLFRWRGRDQELAGQVRRLKSECRAAKAAGDAGALARIREEVWGLQAHLVSVVPARGEARLASLLSDLARMSLPLEMDAGNWARAFCACSAMAISVRTSLGALEGSGVLASRIALWKLLFSEVPEIAEAAAYTAHRAGRPFDALGPLESLTSIIAEQRMSLTVLRGVQEGVATRPDAEDDLLKAIARRTGASAAARQGGQAGRPGLPSAGR
jgi:hypothetical protein